MPATRLEVGQHRAGLHHPQAGIVLDHGAAIGDVNQPELRDVAGERLLVEAGSALAAAAALSSGSVPVENRSSCMIGTSSTVIGAPIALRLRADRHRAAGSRAAALEFHGADAELFLVEEDVPGEEGADQPERDAERGNDQVARPCSFLGRLRRTACGLRGCRAAGLRSGRYMKPVDLVRERALTGA